MNEIKSPLTGGETKLVTKVSVSTIVSLYQEWFNIDISNYFTGLKEVSIYQCAETGYSFYHPLNITAKPEFYRELSKFNKGYYPEWKWENDNSLPYLRPTDKIIDIGCGRGHFLTTLEKKGFTDLIGIDTSIESRLENNINFKNTDLNTFKTEQKGIFDVVTCFQILEHITEVDVFIQSCCDLLVKGGLLIIAVPNNNPFLFKRDINHVLNLPPHHTGLWSEESLTKLSNYFDLELVSIKPQPIGKDLGYYIFVQIEYLKKKNKLLKIVLSSRITKKLIYIYYNLKKSYLRGHSVLAIYKKAI